MNLVDVEHLREIAEVEFADIVAEAIVPDVNELRVFLIDSSFVDVWFSLKLHGRYSSIGNDAPLMVQSIAMTTRLIDAGKR
jgi:hypothetical protein